MNTIIKNLFKLVILLYKNKMSDFLSDLIIQD